MLVESLLLCRPDRPRQAAPPVCARDGASAPRPRPAGARASPRRSSPRADAATPAWTSPVTRAAPFLKQGAARLGRPGRHVGFGAVNSEALLDAASRTSPASDTAWPRSHQFARREVGLPGARRTAPFLRGLGTACVSHSAAARRAFSGPPASFTCLSASRSARVPSCGSRTLEELHRGFYCSPRSSWCGQLPVLPSSTRTACAEAHHLSDAQAVLVSDCPEPQAAFPLTKLAARRQARARDLRPAWPCEPRTCSLSRRRFQPLLSCRRLSTARRTSVTSLLTQRKSGAQRFHLHRRAKSAAAFPARTRRGSPPPPPSWPR